MAPHPDLLSLATQARERETALLWHDNASSAIHVPTGAPDPGEPPEPLLGVRCATSVVAVGYPALVVVHGADRIVDELIGISVDRRGLMEFVAPPSAPALTPAAPTDVTIDIGLRALGLATQPSEKPIHAFIDRLWVDRVVELALMSDLGDPPRWREISRCHPLADGLACSPEHLRMARSELHLEWEACRRSVARSGLSGGVMSAALAHWFDAGSFARRLLATLPDLDIVLPDLDELLRPRDAEWLRASLPPTLRIR